MRALIDTCVMIDGLNDREHFAVHAQQILLAIERGHIEGCVTAKSLMDIYYICHHEMHNRARVNQAVDWILNYMTILDTTDDDCRQAFAAGWRDFEDALMSQTATRCNISCIVTRNTKDFIYSPVPIYTPEQLIQKIAR